MSEKTTIRRRRRWQWIATGILIFCAWWFWPRADGRYVGRWACWFEANPNAVSTLILRNNGGGRTLVPDGSGVDFYQWQAKGDHLVFGPIGGRRSSSILHWITERTGPFGVTFLPVEVTFQIVSSDRDVIRCRTTKTSEPIEFELRRIE